MPQKIFTLVKTHNFGIISVILLIYAVGGQFFLSTYDRANDDFEHLAAIRSFADSPTDPSHPYSLDTEYSHLFTPYHLFWGLVSRLLSISPFWITPLIALVNTLIFLFSVHLFVKKFISDNTSGVLLLLTFLFLWLLPPGYSGFYQFSHILKTSIYPFRLAFSLSLIVFSVFPNESHSYRDYPVLLLVPFIFIIHPITAIFLLVIFFLKIWFQEISTARKLLLMVYISGSLGLAFLWPFFPVLKTVTGFNDFSQIQFGGDYKEFYQGQFLICALPALPGLLILKHNWTADNRVKIMGLSFFAFLIIYISNFAFIGSSTFGRAIIFVTFALQILVVLGVKDFTQIGISKKLRLAYFLFLLILSVPQLYIAFKSLSFISDFKASKEIGYHSNFSFAQRLDPFIKMIEKNKVLIAPPNESWVLPCLTGVKVFAIKHPDPFIDPAKFRMGNRIIEEFYSKNCDPEVLANAGVNFDYILLPEKNSYRFNLKSYHNLRIIYKNNQYTLIKRN